MSLTREERVTILLTTFLDYLPDPKTSSGQIARSASPGPVAQELAPCTLCLGRGRVRGGGACLICPTRIRFHALQDVPRHRCTECPVCDGTGWRQRRHGEEPHDPMTGMSQSELAAAAEVPSPIGDRGSAGKASGGDGDPLERSRKRRDRNGSYQELDRALEKMRDRKPGYYMLVWHVLVCGEPIVLGTSSTMHLKHAVAWLADEMRTHRVPPWTVGQTDEQKDARKRSLWWGRTHGHDQQRGSRNAEIRSAVAAGEKVAAVARRFGYSREHVHRILKSG